MPAAKAIVGGQIIDGTGAEPIRNGLVLIDGERIAYVGREDARRIPPGAVRIDAAGASVLPGLMDAHVHISLNAPSDLVADLTGRSIGRIAFDVAANLRDTVAAGVTTIRTVSDVAHLDIAARDAIRRGVAVGPRIVPCGKGLTTTGGHGQLLPCWLCMSHGEISDVVDGVDAVRKAVRRQIQAGAHWIKVFQTGGVIDPEGRIDAEEFTPSEFDAAVETAHIAGLPVAVHAHNRPGILRSIRAGCRSIEHGMHFDEECAAEAAQRGAYYVPTLTVMDRIIRHGAQAGLPAYMIDNVRQRTSKHHEYVKAAFDAGVGIACGTDAGSLLTPHGSAGREVVHFVDCGLTPVQAIATATRTTARMLKIDEETGSLEAGKRADIIVVDGDAVANPRALEVASNMRQVLVNGRVVAERGRIVNGI
ncbi:MAG: amidohydrolase family protein [Proteobacteria bacterium]|nr:amidohydrolase family protein [Pseudomonadota bacterium]